MAGPRRTDLHQPSSPQLIPKREDLTMKHMVRTGMAWAGPPPRSFDRDLTVGTDPNPQR